MDKDTEAYFNKYWELFASEGWQQFMQDMEDNRSLMSDIMTIKGADDFHFRKGQLEILNRIVNFQAAMEAAYKDLTDESNL